VICDGRLYRKPAVFTSFAAPAITAPREGREFPRETSGPDTAEATEASRKINDFQTRHQTEADRGGPVASVASPAPRSVKEKISSFFSS
jgi:hypothetical protein